MLRSLRTRIQVWYGLLLAIVIITLTTILYVQQRRARFAAIDDELTAAHQVLIRKLQVAPAELLQRLIESAGTADVPLSSEQVSDDGQLYQSNEARKLAGDLQLPRTFRLQSFHDQDELPYFSIWRSDGRLIKRSADHAPLRLIPIQATLGQPGRPMRRGNLIFTNRDRLREARAIGPQGTMVLVGRRIDRDVQNIRALLAFLVGAGAAVFGFGLLGGWMVSGRAIASIKKITQATSDRDQ